MSIFRRLLLILFGMFLLAAMPPPMPPAAQAVWQVTRFAGEGVAGSREGLRHEARFNWPTDVVMGPDWNAYVADFGNHRIRRISATGRVTTLAGNGKMGAVDGVGAAAMFNGPNSLVLGPDGALYVADAGNARIRRVALDGRVTTVAGGLPRGVVDGPVAQARFLYPTGLAFDDAGLLYVVDRWANNIRVITPQGQVGTVAGAAEEGFVDGAGRDARFHDPLNGVWDPHWGLVITDSGNHAIRALRPDGSVMTLVGGPRPGGRDGGPDEAGFAWPTGIASDRHGYLYVTDAENHRVRRISRTLNVVSLAGSGETGVADGPGPLARFSFITGISIDPTGNLLLADSRANRLRWLVRAVPMQVLRAGEGPSPS